ncbi:MAG TPA: PilT/PilU family type 4a pilus ATPase [bacterium]|nr:PilT/PilU family type 4a pilus ATPase [bacterium]
MLIHNKLIGETQLKQARTFLDQNSGQTLLDVLTRAGIVKERHAEIIRRRYQELQSGGTNQTASVAPEPPPSGAPSAKPDGQAARTLPDYLAASRKLGASDLHIIPNLPPVIRLHGRLKRLQDRKLSAEETEALLFGVLSPEARDRLHHNQALDTCLEIPGQGRYRSCFIRQTTGWDGAFRIIRTEVPTLKSLGLPESVQRLTEYNQGLVLVTGPAGAGKSTTLAAMVELVNQTRNEHIITLEDPIEYVFTPVKSHISQRAVASHTLSFAAALRAALREDPDVILIGELRDRDTASLAITAAETGHLVFATLHTNSASQTIMRLMDFFPPDQQGQIRAMVSESIRGIVCQRLIPAKSGDGRVLALEIMFNNSAIANLIREDKLFQIPNMIRINRRDGMQLLEESIQELLRAGRIDPTEAHHAIVEQMLFQDQGENKGR